MTGKERRVAIVTGGTRGLGRSIAERLLGDGWDVLVCGRRLPDIPVTGGGAQAHAVTADVRDPDAAGALVAEAIARFGRLDLLVNNAGGAPAADFASSSLRLVERIIALNLLGPLYVTHAAFAHLGATGGSVVNIASVSGVRPSPGTTAYGAAKAGLISATTSLAQEWGPHGVRVNAIVVGLVEDPDQTQHYGGPEGVTRIGARIPLGRMARGGDLADVVAWLASPGAGYVSGACIELHGGGEPPAFLTLARD